MTAPVPAPRPPSYLHDIRAETTARSVRSADPSYLHVAHARALLNRSDEDGPGGRDECCSDSEQDSPRWRTRARSCRVGGRRSRPHRHDHSLGECVDAAARHVRCEFPTRTPPGPPPPVPARPRPPQPATATARARRGSARPCAPRALRCPRPAGAAACGPRSRRPCRAS
jgi:hypothetical protein